MAKKKKETTKKKTTSKKVSKPVQKRVVRADNVEKTKKLGYKLSKKQGRYDKKDDVVLMEK